MISNYYSLENQQNVNSELILLGHGSGGRLSHQLLDELIIPNPERHDSGRSE